MFLTSVILYSTFGGFWPQCDSSEKALELIEEYMASQLSFGNDHPRMHKLREQIKGSVDADYRFDLPQVQARFEKLISDRAVLLKTKGLSHPVVVENATRITLMSRLLAGQSRQVLRDIFKASK